MIISLRGTHGSGKSHVVRSLIERYNGVYESTDAKGRPLAYEMTLQNGSKLYAVGSYLNACGGCDGIQPYALIWPRVEQLAAKGHVIFEGALVSNSYGNIGRASEKYGDQMVFAFLNTPLEICISRILKRRRERGNTNSFDPQKSVVRIYKSNENVMRKAVEFGRRVVVVDYRKAVPKILGLLYGG